MAVAVNIGIVCPCQTSSPHPSPKSESKPESESAHPVLFLYFSTLYFLFFSFVFDHESLISEFFAFFALATFSNLLLGCQDEVMRIWSYTLVRS